MNKDLIEFISIFKDIIDINIYDKKDYYEIQITQDLEHELNPIEGIDFNGKYTVDDYTETSEEVNKIIDQVMEILDKYLQKHKMVEGFYTGSIYWDPREPDLGQIGIEYTYVLKKNEKTKALYSLLKEEKT